VLNPADQEVIGYAPVADAELVDQAVTAAADAFPSWSKLPATRRASHLSAIASWIRSDTLRLAHILTLEQGKPLSEATGEVQAAAKAFDYYAAEAVRVYGQTIPTESETLRSLVLRQPFGVVAAITPGTIRSAHVLEDRPALAAGCTVVAKPSKEAPLTVLEVVSGAVRSDCPPGPQLRERGRRHRGQPARLTSQGGQDHFHRRDGDRPAPLEAGR